jgi:phage gp16-like protein
MARLSAHGTVIDEKVSPTGNTQVRLMSDGCILQQFKRMGWKVGRPQGPHTAAHSRGRESFDRITFISEPKRGAKRR